MGKSTISMAIFNSYVSLPEGNWCVSYKSNKWCKSMANLAGRMASDGDLTSLGLLAVAMMATDDHWCQQFCPRSNTNLDLKKQKQIYTMNPQTDLNAILNFKRWKPWKTHHNEVRQVALDSNHQLPSTTRTSVKRRFFSLLRYATPATTPAATTPEMTTVFVAAWRGVCRALAMTGNGVSRRAAQGSAGAPQHGVVGSISSFFGKNEETWRDYQFVGFRGFRLVQFTRPCHL